nr:reverse transcriptase domain-containing protein [Tanacetum cinerariifolium]
MDKVRRDKQREVHAKLDFGEGSTKRRTREDSHHSSAKALTTRPERLKVRDRLRYDDRHVIDRLGHRRQSPFDRLSETYSPSTTKSKPGMTNSRDHSRGRSRPHRMGASNEGCPEDMECFHGVGDSYDDSYSHSYHDRDRSRYMKRRRDNQSPLSSVSKSDFSDGRYRKSKSKRHKPTNEDDLTRPWMFEEEDLFTPRIHNFESSCRTRMPNNVKTYDETGDPEDHVKISQAASQVERWAMPTWWHMFNSTLIGATRVWFDEFPLKSVDSYKDLKAAFLAYLMQQKKYVKDLVEIHNIKQKDEETIKNFIERTSKEILAAEAGKFQPPPPMVTPVEKRSSNKFCDFHNDKGHSTDECMQLKKQIEELVRAGKLSHLIKEIKHGRDQSKVEKKETPAKDKPTEIYMLQSWQRMKRQKGIQSFERVREITFPPLTTSNGAEGPLVIEAEIDGHIIHRMYVDEGSSMEILYERCFNRLRLEVKNQMVSATASLTGFSGETIWPLGQLRLLVTIGDADHSTRAWMNFMIVRSLSPYNGIIRRPGIKEIQAVPSTAHEMLKFLVDGGIVTIHFPDQEVAIGGTLFMKGRTELCSLLKENLDIFAWQPSDMTGVPRLVAEHRLNIQEGYSPVRQKKRGQASERAKAIQAEVQKLVEAGIMRKRLVDKAFDSQISRNIKVYVKDLVVKSHTEAEMLREIVEGVFLGYMVTPEGIKLCPDKTTAVLQLSSPRTIKEVQSLNGKLASLNRFLSKSVKKSLPLFKTLKKCIKKSDFYWTSKVEQAFKQLKQHLLELPLLVACKPKEELIVYLSASYGAISPVLMTERGEIQMSVYFTLFTDGSSCVDESGAGLILILEGTEFTYTLRFQFVASNNEAEYEALIAGLRIATHMRVKNVHVSVDSKLVANQVLGTYVAKEENMIEYLEKVKSLEGGKKAPHQGLTVRIIGGGSLQAVIPYAVVKVRRTTPGGEGIKARLGEGNKNWIEELPHVLWAHRTIIKSSHGDTPFSLTYGTEAVIPVVIRMPTYRTAAVDIVYSDEELWLNRDLLEERRERAAVCEAKAKLKMTKYYNARVRGINFKPCDFVYRSNDASHTVDGGKL